MRASTILLKGCPRCRGDLFLEHEPLGWSLSCLQCGYTSWLNSDDEATQSGAPTAVPALDGEKIAA